MMKPSHTDVFPRNLLWQFSVLALLVLFLYRDVGARLIVQWWNDPNFSHGFFVPMFSIFVLWNDRNRLARTPMQSSNWGLPVIVGSLALLVVGVLGAELFLSRSSIVFLLGGLEIYYLGWAFFRATFFPWAFLFLMIPIPAIIFNQIAFPLQVLASHVATTLLDFSGIPVLREGNVLKLPNMEMEVAEACSGIRSLVSLTTLAIIYGYFLEKKFWPKFFLAVGAIPIAVAANAMRVTGTGLLGQWWDPDKALGFFHTFSGWVIFVLSLILLFGLHGLIHLFAKTLRRRKPATA
ncbi:MAG: exosortase [Acidobacteria bacterium]|nr:exosortase [Acidobacteriota bacterium]